MTEILSAGKETLNGNHPAAPPVHEQAVGQPVDMFAAQVGGTALELQPGQSLADFLAANGELVPEDSAAVEFMPLDEVAERIAGAFTPVTTESGKKKGEVTAEDIQLSIQESCIEIARVNQTDFAGVAMQLERNPYIDYGDTRQRMVNAWLDASATRAFPNEGPNREHFRYMLDRQFSDYQFVRGRLLNYVDQLNEYAQAHVADQDESLAFLFSLDNLTDNEIQAQIAAEEEKERLAQEALAAEAAQQAESKSKVRSTSIQAMLEQRQQEPLVKEIMRKIEAAKQSETPANTSEEPGLPAIKRLIHAAEQRKQEQADQTLRALIEQPPVIELEHDLQKVARYLYALFNQGSMEAFSSRLRAYSALNTGRSAELSQMVMDYITLDRHLNIHSLKELDSITTKDPEKMDALRTLKRRLSNVSIVGLKYTEGTQHQVHDFFSQCVEMGIPESTAEVVNKAA